MKKRVIECDGEWYYLSPEAPKEIETRDELIRWSLGRGAPYTPHNSTDYDVEIRGDLSEYRDGTEIALYENQEAKERALALFTARAENTKAVYGRAIDEFYSFVQKALGDLTVQDVLSYIKHLQELVESREISPATYNLKVNALRSYFKLFKGYLKQDPFEVLKKQGIKIKYKQEGAITEEKYFTIEEILSVLAYWRGKNSKYVNLIRALFQSGCRISELLSLKVGDFSENNEFVKAKVLGKGGKEREIRLRKEVFEDILEDLPEGGDDRYLFYTREGNPLNRVTAYRWIRDAFREALGRRATPHMLRHSIATYLLDRKSESIKGISRFLGHSSTAITNDFYVHTRVKEVNIPKI